MTFSFALWDDNILGEMPKSWYEIQYIFILSFSHQIVLYDMTLLILLTFKSTQSILREISRKIIHVYVTQSYFKIPKKYSRINGKTNIL